MTLTVEPAGTPPAWPVAGPSEVQLGEHDGPDLARPVDGGSTVKTGLLGRDRCGSRSRRLAVARLAEFSLSATFWCPRPGGRHRDLTVRADRPGMR